MKLNHGIGSIAFLFVTPLVTGLSVGIAPSSAAIIAGSAAFVAIDNFSHRLKLVHLLTLTLRQSLTKV